MRISGRVLLIWIGVLLIWIPGVSGADMITGI